MRIAEWLRSAECLRIAEWLRIADEVGDCSAIRGARSAIRGARSAIRGARSAIRNPQSAMSLSHASCRRRPDVFVELQLQSSGQTIGEHPLGERLRIQY